METKQPLQDFQHTFLQRIFDCFFVVLFCAHGVFLKILFKGLGWLLDGDWILKRLFAVHAYHIEYLTDTNMA